MTLESGFQAARRNLKIGVIGGGAAGIVAAHYLSRDHDVELFEAASMLGGHVQTVMAPDDDGHGSRIPVDMGFIVFNDRTYPCFHRFIAELGLRPAATEMSFSYSEPDTGFAYAGTSYAGLFARRANAIDPAFWRMLLALRRFCRSVSSELAGNRLPEATLGAYLREQRYPDVLLRRYLAPMVQAIWSGESHAPETFPLRRFVRFFANHGLLAISGGPQWQYLPGGSRTYVQAFERTFKGKVHLDSPVQAVRRLESGPSLLVKGAEVRFDAVVLSCHADTALALLTDADELERECLRPWHYTANDVVLHRDASFLPANRRAWACWNVIADAHIPGPTGSSKARVHVHYWMNRLQRLAAQQQHVVTLNPRRPVPQELQSRRLELHHPQFTEQSLHAQARLPELQGRHWTYFCGSYHGNGFHEDAAASGVRVAELLGISI